MKKLLLLCAAFSLVLGCNSIPDVPDWVPVPTTPSTNAPTPVDPLPEPEPAKPPRPITLEHLTVQSIAHEQGKLLVTLGPMPFIPFVDSVWIVTTGQTFQAVCNFPDTTSPQVWSTVGYWDISKHFLICVGQGYMRVGDTTRVAVSPVLEHDPIPK